MPTDHTPKQSIMTIRVATSTWMLCAGFLIGKSFTVDGYMALTGFALIVAYWIIVWTGGPDE